MPTEGSWRGRGASASFLGGLGGRNGEGFAPNEQEPVNPPPADSSLHERISPHPSPRAWSSSPGSGHSQDGGHFMAFPPPPLQLPNNLGPSRALEGPRPQGAGSPIVTHTLPYSPIVQITSRSPPWKQSVPPISAPSHAPPTHLHAEFATAHPLPQVSSPPKTFKDPGASGSENREDRELGQGGAYGLPEAGSWVWRAGGEDGETGSGWGYRLYEIQQQHAPCPQKNAGPPPRPSLDYKTFPFIKIDESLSLYK